MTPLSQYLSWRCLFLWRDQKVNDKAYWNTYTLLFFLNLMYSQDCTICTQQSLQRGPPLILRASTSLAFVPFFKCVLIPMHFKALAHAAPCALTSLLLSLPAFHLLCSSHPSDYPSVAFVLGFLGTAMLSFIVIFSAFVTNPSASFTGFKISWDWGLFWFLLIIGTRLSEYLLNK